MDELEVLVRTLESDARAGVRDAVAIARRRMREHAAETARLQTMHVVESRLRAQGFSRIAGVDEVGRGALAGPVTAAAVVLPPEALISGLDDSKRLTPRMREIVADEVCDIAISFAVAHVPAHVIDVIGISRAVRTAMDLALSRLDPPPDHAITDGLRVGLPLPETPVIGADATVASVAAASVVAKVTRDRLMTRFASHYPDWTLDANKGYATSTHIDSIARSGLSPIHRRSFSPCSATPTLF